MVLKGIQDAYGREVFDYLQKRPGMEVVEREDGFIDPSKTLPAYYFSDFRDWRVHERRAMRFVKGRVLDIGCGAGRVSLYLQRKGFDVVGIDISPLAVRVSRLRGLKKATALSITQIAPKLGGFDTLLMLGNNFGLFANVKRAKWLLKRFYRTTSNDARIIAESTDPYKTNEPDHLAYQRLNRTVSRMSGQIRMRVRYRKYSTPWFDYLLVSKNEMRELVNGTGWQIKRILDHAPQYIAVIGKAPSHKPRSA